MVLQTTSHGGRNFSSKTQKQNSIKTSKILIQKSRKIKDMKNLSKHRKLTFQKITFQPVTKAEVKMGQNATKAK